MVGVTGFEPATSSSRSNRPDRLTGANVHVGALLMSVDVHAAVPTYGTVVTQFDTQPSCGTQPCTRRCLIRGAPVPPGGSAGVGVLLVVVQVPSKSPCVTPRPVGSWTAHPSLSTRSTAGCPSRGRSLSRCSVGAFRGSSSQVSRPRSFMPGHRLPAGLWSALMSARRPVPALVALPPFLVILASTIGPCQHS